MADEHQVGLPSAKGLTLNQHVEGSNKDLSKMVFADEGRQLQKKLRQERLVAWGGRRLYH